MDDGVVLTEFDDIDLASVNQKAKKGCMEADLHKDYDGCQKNPGHKKFVPLQDFTIDHLPSGYRSKVIVDLIKAEADLTCFLSVTRSSDNRPQFYPGTLNPYPFSQAKGCRTGTGFVKYVHKFTESDCECEKCMASDPGKPIYTPKKVWGKVQIITACHVVFNSEEARHTTCYFFYDESTIKFRHECPTLTGLEVVKSDIEGDVCMMTCVTHDIDLLDKLIKLCDRRMELFENVRVNYWDADESSVSYIKHPKAGHVIIVSHPHGCQKQITIGEWTHRQTQGDTKRYQENSGLEAESICTSYRYNAATCPGSSGAPVIRLLETGRVEWWWLLDSHPHSRRAGEKDSLSGMMREYISCRPPPEKKWSRQTITLTALVSFVVCVFLLALGLVLIVKRGLVTEPFFTFIVVLYNSVLNLAFLWCWRPYKDLRVLRYMIILILSLGLQPLFFLLGLLGVNYKRTFWTFCAAWGLVMNATPFFEMWRERRQKRQTVLQTQRSLRESTSRPCSRHF